jgi:diadenosine tetraphosphate (Ap4A) HIT family hydrolase
MVAESEMPEHEMTEAPTSSCPFCCRIASGDIDRDFAHAVSFPDRYPLNPGHTLVVPRRHVSDIYELTRSERAGLWRLVDDVALALRERSAVDGLNVGVNIGGAAGQTVGHAHVHVVPRHAGDVDDPRGGIRSIIPGRAAYWSTS